MATPNPLVVASQISRPRPEREVEPESRKAECLWCAKVTAHVPGPVTQVGDGAAAVHWWTCVECSEGRTVL